VGGGGGAAAAAASFVCQYSNDTQCGCNGGGCSRGGGKLSENVQHSNHLQISLLIVLY
jgi:hypothetical protein